ncbi:pseudouridine synthase [Rhodobacter aestuarii]|uniref:Pseudouridine synthase n=1 Tax=Rhodobacter aestuarii TaxID=453582 RepID=A0A1N7KU61_9RHOB|nr:pseudouridine synthase [Rhodobacter aestuarii]PTV95568.1 pseudouridine synthase [Rhodobacter aestuarii]SIS65129.1 23S rRNA pseudouridine2605 synthase [Rhodobacter aestuarii]
MADAPNLPESAERIAKVIARSGVASRRDAEKMILAGRVTVNGKRIESPALDVLPNDKVAIDGKPIDAPQETRLWLYYKPLGLVTTEKDEQGRRTIFDEMPEGMPRVLNVGRLDLNSEGLLLLTNDGGLKRRLELPETGWLRKYRVRVNGRPLSDTFNPLREGLTIEGEDFQPMEVSLDRQQGANAWLTVGIREGKNREIRRAMAEVGMTVNRLIRVSYGPFRLNDMQPGDVMEVKRKLLRDQLGDRLLFGIEDGKPSRAEREEARGARRGPKPGGRGEFKPRDARGEDGEAPKKGFGRQRDFSEGAEPQARKPRAFGSKSHHDDDRKPFSRREDGDRKPFARREDGDRKPFARRDDGDRKPFGRREDGEGKRPFKPRFDGEKKPFGKRDDGDRKPFGKREDGDRKPYQRREDGEGNRSFKPRFDGEKKPYGKRDDGDRKPFNRREDGDRKPYARREDGDRKPYAKREDGDRKPYAKREDGDRKPYPRRDDGDRKPYARREDGDRKPFGSRSGGDKPGFKSAGFKSHGGKPGGKPRSEGFKSHGDDARKGGDFKPSRFKGGKPGPKRG